MEEDETSFTTPQRQFSRMVTASNQQRCVFFFIFFWLLLPNKSTQNRIDTARGSFSLVQTTSLLCRTIVICSTCYKTATKKTCIKVAGRTFKWPVFSEATGIGGFSRLLEHFEGKLATSPFGIVTAMGAIHASELIWEPRSKYNRI
jgi:hypothetical protein